MPIVVEKKVSLGALKDAVRVALPHLATFSNPLLRLRIYTLEKDMVAAVLGGVDANLHEHEGPVQGLDYHTNIMVESR